MSHGLRTVSPIDGAICVERPYADAGQVQTALSTASSAQREWRHTPIAERASLCDAFVEAFESRGEEIAREITLQMGRPIAYSPGEVGGLAERARYMSAIAADALADVRPEPQPGFERFIRREPLGRVLVIAPWNYPYLTAVNAVVPAILAGNSVILRHSAQTPLCAERFAEAFEAAGLPEGVFQTVHCDHATTEEMIRSSSVDFVAFTGSVDGGRAVQHAARDRFIGVGLELGGKDPAYVREDADLAHSAEGVVDGAFFNSGQSCCGIERAYVHASVYDEFVDRARALVCEYRLGNPLEAETSLGPMVRTSAADWVRDQIAQACASGAQALVDPGGFPADDPGTPYLAPQLLVDVDHSMAVMREESFGPVLGIMRVESDDEAVHLMNDSNFGLTASIWTGDAARALELGDRIETGTVFMNRCDYLDPALAWTGVKDSGRGCTLSRVGFEALTRPKSFHLRD